MRISFLAGAIALSATPALAALLPVHELIREGDMVAGVGNVTSIDNLAINGVGQWYIDLDTNFATSPGDGVILGGFGTTVGGVAYREAQALASPPGATISSFDALTINDSGNSGWNFFLADTGATTNDSGIYFNANLVVQESNVSTAPQFSANTPYVGFFEAWINNSNRIAVMASMDDPAILSTVDRAIVMIDNPGGVFTETVLAKEGDQLLPGRFVTDFGTGPQDSDLNDAGDFMYFADLDGDTVTDGTVWINNTKIAQEGMASPEVGRLYSTLSSRPRDINNSGDYAFRADLDGATTDDEVIIKNGAIFVREGDSPSDIAGFQLTGFGTAPIEMDDNGNIVWFGDWNDPDTTKDTGLFYNNQLIVQEGVTTVGGLVLDDIRGIQDGFTISRDGSWVLVRGVLVGGIDVAFLVAVPEPASAMLLAAGLALVVRRRR